VCVRSALLACLEERSFLCLTIKRAFFGSVGKVEFFVSCNQERIFWLVWQSENLLIFSNQECDLFLLKKNHPYDKLDNSTTIKSFDCKT
jgi:hypothetical protein